MDTSRKINSRAGKGSRYRPSETAENFGQPNMVAPGAGISANARIPTQAHGSARGGSQAPTDMSQGKPSGMAAPGDSVGNTGPHPAGVAGAAPSVAGGANIPPPGDGARGRRGSPPAGKSSERYRGR